MYPQQLPQSKHMIEFSELVNWVSLPGIEGCDSISEEVHKARIQCLDMFWESQITCYNGEYGLNEKVVKGRVGKNYKIPFIKRKNKWPPFNNFYFSKT